MLEAFKNLPRRIKVGNKYVGEGEPTFIIAEIGNNHNGDIELARRSVIEAARAGADAVKFQKRFLDEVFTKEMLDKSQTSSRTLALGATYGEYRRKLELNEEQLMELKELAHSLGVVFFVTPFDLKSAELLERIGMDAWKIASFDLTHKPLLEWVAKKSQPVFISTGMSTLEEISEAVETILQHNNQVIINHCVSVYPTPDDDLNLGAVTALQENFKPLPTGYSGHELGFVPTVVAVALGATTVERHFTLDKTLPGPDHATVSLDVAEFAEMVRQIRKVEKAVRDKTVYLHEQEIPIRAKHSKSLVSRVAITVGTLITGDMLCCKSPGHGLKPFMLDKVIGKKIKKDVPADTVITNDIIEW